TRVFCPTKKPDGNGSPRTFPSVTSANRKTSPSWLCFSARREPATSQGNSSRSTAALGALRRSSAFLTWQNALQDHRVAPRRRAGGIVTNSDVGRRAYLLSATNRREAPAQSGCRTLCVPARIGRRA